MEFEGSYQSGCTSQDETGSEVSADGDLGEEGESQAGSLPPDQVNYGSRREPETTRKVGESSGLGHSENGEEEPEDQHEGGGGASRREELID